MRFDTSIGLKKRYKTVLENFRGVDLSSSPLNVAGSRATEAYNFICENGVNHKRPGWREFLNFGAEINGVFPFREADGAEVLLVHAGTALYRAARGVDGKWGKQPISKGTEGITSTRSQCFYRNGIAFIVGCGAYLAYGRHGGAEYGLLPVSEIAYVPTTTVSIDAANVKDTVRAALDDINLLTPWRINELNVAGNIPTESEHKGVYYTIDAVPDESSKVTVTYVYTTGSSAQYDLLLKGAGGQIASVRHNYVTVSISGSRIFVYRDNTYEDETQEATAQKWSDSLLAVHIKFSVTRDEALEKIANCRFGTLFGVDGTSDRLFLSGNPAYPNKDFFSEAEDFTYFPDGNVLTVGDEDAAVTGYARLSDATLAVFKGESVGGPAIFYRTGEERTMTDADGHEVLTALFPTVPGTVGEHLVTPHAVANLSGDVLMLSPNGVFGIELSSNVSSVERYARERSRAIYEDLKTRTLEDAVGVVFRGRYYLAVGDGICYVADSRYRASLEGSTDTGYEWWVWDNIPARVFSILDDGLIFGTVEGRLCLFDELFTDRYYTELGEGAVKQSGEYLVFDSSAIVDVKSGDRLTVDGALYALVLDDCKVTEGCVRLPEELLDSVIRHLWEGAVVYADRVGTSGLAVGVAYTVKDLDLGKLTFRLCDADGSALTLAAEDFRLCASLSGVECITRFEDTTHARLCDLAEVPWSLVPYNQGDASKFTGRYTHYSPVVASWVSPVLDFGSNMDRKTLLAITVAIDDETGGDITFGYETRRGEWSGTARTGGGGLDFDNLDFNYFTFGASAFATAFTKRLNVRNFNYIRFVFRSQSESDCAVNGVTLYYKINQTNRGLF